MGQAEARAAFVRANPGIRRPGKGGYWYRCAHCGKWCGRPGRERANIPDHERMEVDHIQSWYNGGSDKIWNLQPLCKPCNRSKGADPTFKDNIKILRNSIIHPVDAVCSVGKKSIRQNKTLRKLGLNSRR